MLNEVGKYVSVFMNSSTWLMNNELVLGTAGNFAVRNFTRETSA
jgi:hypothetical protein